MKPVAIFRHSPIEGPGYFATFLDRHSIPWTLIRIDEQEAVPAAIDGFSGLAFMGGPMSVNDPLPWIAQSCALIRTAAAAGLPVLGEGGPISIPTDTQVSIAADGTISAVTLGQSAANVIVAGRLKLVNPERGDLVRGADSLFRPRGGAAVDVDPSVKVVAGALEDSNVNTVATMVEMINLARQYDLHMKVLQSADSNAQRANQLLSAG
mgnify:CR=1 FL=1